MSTIFVKRSVEKDGLPDFEKLAGNSMFYIDFSDRLCVWKFGIATDEDDFRAAVKYYLEELPSPSQETDKYFETAKWINHNFGSVDEAFKYLLYNFNTPSAVTPQGITEKDFIRLSEEEMTDEELAEAPIVDESGKELDLTKRIDVAHGKRNYKLALQMVSQSLQQPKMEKWEAQEKACEILRGVEFKDEKAIAKAVFQLSNYFRDNFLSTQMDEDIASEVACHLLRMTYLSEAERNVGAFDDKFIIERYKDEWSWFMQGWKEAKKNPQSSESPMKSQQEAVTYTCTCKFPLTKQDSDGVYCGRCQKNIKN
jgi:hypothetical protein